MLKIHQHFIRTFILIFAAVLLTLSVITYFWSKNIYIHQIEKNLVQNIDTLSIVLTDLNNVE
ncbi:MAG: sensor histidine kinase, partial [Poseidonibacter sp.]